MELGGASASPYSLKGGKMKRYLFSIIAIVLIATSLSFAGRNSKKNWLNLLPKDNVVYAPGGMEAGGVIVYEPSSDTAVVQASSNTTLSITDSVMYLTASANGAAILMGGTPVISTTAHEEGATVMIVNVGTYTFTFQDEDSETGTLLELPGDADVVLGQFGILGIRLIKGSWRNVHTEGVSITLSGTIAAEQVTSTDDATITDDLSVGGLTTIGETLAVTGAQTFTGATGVLGALTMGTAAADGGVFSIIKGATGSDPTFSITQAATSVTIAETVGDINITAADDVTITATGSDIALVGDVNISGDADVNGSLLLDVTVITTSGLASTQLLTTSQSGYIVVRATEAVTLQLPAVSGNAGLTYTVCKDTVAVVAVSAVTIDPNASELIGGASTNNQIDNYYDYLTFFTDGTVWFITAELEH